MPSQGNGMAQQRHQQNQFVQSNNQTRPSHSLHRKNDQRRRRRRRDSTERSKKSTCAGNIARAFLGLAVVQCAVIIVIIPLLYGHHQQQLTTKASAKSWPESSSELHDDDDNEENNANRLRDPSSSLSSRTKLRMLNTNTKPLDDYMTREHIAPIDHIQQHKDQPLEKNVSLEEDMSDLPILVVGGSDGSGTRAFVDMLGRLGVPMVVDDIDTLDVHANCMFQKAGWPPLVRIVLEQTKAANYSWEDLSLTQQTELQKQTDAFVKHYGQRGEGLRKHGISQGFNVSSNVLYGFKAPVSMLLLPVLRQAFGKIKFVHVVRDGRDVSLSKNKSPVSKFYQVFYPNAKERRGEFEAIEGDIVFEEAMAMQLWNDWNTQVLDWERRNSDGETFDYLVMRVEDLTDPRTRLTSLRQLADFVGSNKNDNELCCLSKQKIMDMGKSGSRSTAPKNLKPQSWGEWLYSFMPLEMRRLYVKCLWLYQRIGVFFGLRPALRRPLNPADWDGRRQGSTEALTDEQDLPMPDLSSLVRRGQKTSVDETEMEKRKAKLLQKIQERRDRREHERGRRNHGRGLMEFAQPGDDQDEENAAETFRNAVHRFKTKHVPFRARPVLDHVKFDTMLERIKEVEEEDKERKAQQLLSQRGSPDGAFWGKQSNQIQRLLTPPGAGHSEQQEAPEQVMQRYGKWRKAVQDRPELSRILHKEGKYGLEMFGYEPNVWFSDFPRQENPDTMTCEPTKACPIIPSKSNEEST